MKDKRRSRLLVLAGSLIAVLLVYLWELYDIQVNRHESFLASSSHSIAREETIEASRGIITDRKGRPLVSNSSVYNLVFDSSLLRDGEDLNEAILRLLDLCEREGKSWTDSLPVSRAIPWAYTLDHLQDAQKLRFFNYLRTVKPAEEALRAYLLEHPSLSPPPEPEENAEGSAADPAEEETLTPSQRSSILLDRLPASAVTPQLLNGAGLSAVTVMNLLRQELELPTGLSMEQARKILGIRYELACRQLTGYTDYTLTEDIDTTFISLITDGNYLGAKVSRSTTRQYETTWAAHILGTMGALDPDDLEDPFYDDYPRDAMVGKSGAEAAFEQYLRGRNGRRVVSTNNDGKITGQYYATEPEPGSTVELTIDLDFQQFVEETLAETVADMNAADQRKRKDDWQERGAAAVVELVDSGEMLALASYPTYDLSSFRQNWAELNENPATPMLNRATNGAYAPGSTLKPLTAVAALEEELITTATRIRDTGHWSYPGDPQSGFNCWYRAGHGSLNVSQAITNSCNYFFGEMGYQLGMDKLREYLLAFGLGESSGIEIGDRAGTLPENPVGENQAPWAGFGQANQLYTPVQLANYISTLLSGGQHRQAHLLKAVKRYDNSEVVAVGNTDPVHLTPMRDSTLDAVKRGMHDLTTKGALAPYFRSCIVSAGAKTGTAQVGANITNNGVFVCFAPYEDPEIAVSIVIEKGNSGAALASTAVKILNAYFSAGASASQITGENQLLP